MSAKEKTAAGRLPLLPLKDVVVFPRMVVPLLVGRPASVSAVEESLASGNPLLLCAQRDPNIEAPGKDDLYGVGVVAGILQTLRMPDGTMKIVVEGLSRARIVRFYTRGPFAEVTVEPVDEESVQDDENTAVMRMTLSQFETYARMNQRVAPEIVSSLSSITEGGTLADLICAYLSLRPDERQELLELSRPRERLERISALLLRENELLEIEQRVRERVRDQMERSQREYYLHEQLKAIHQELGSREEGADEYAELRAQIEKAKMPTEVREKAFRELARYERMPSMSPEGAIIRTYLEWLIDMPWEKSTKDSLDLDRAIKVLDEDHFGLKKVKERILEFLAVRKLSANMKGPILCLVGPPGVGKTSLGQSIARAMGRKFTRVSLGGVRDEAEIRGHRRTYIGALPGRIVQGLKKCGVRNPVFMLDEIDKTNSDFRGDPASAMLEVLDPEQNSAFSDHYLEVDFDLSQVFFIATANSEYDIPEPLHDRMEIVRLSGYTVLEKEKIAELFLIPRQMKASGLKARHVQFTPEGIRAIIERYTREAGVRELDRQLANACRKVARKVVSSTRAPRTVIDDKTVTTLLGKEEYHDSRADIAPHVGVALGLAWTHAGGDVLNIETSIVRGKGNLSLTGHLGEVMKESAHAAYTYIRAHTRALKVPAQFHGRYDVHIHVPEGAIPKDGPSAGIALAVSLVSALRNIAPREPIAMTGEITLRGRVLPIGGVKEKVLAAHRAGIRKIILPKLNEKDLEELPDEVQRAIKFVWVDQVDEALRVVFGDKK